MTEKDTRKEDEHWKREIDRRIEEKLSDIGFDLSTNSARLEHIQDLVFVREMRVGKKENTKSVTKVLIEKTVSAGVTFISCVIAAAFSWFLTSGVNHK